MIIYYAKLPLRRKPDFLTLQETTSIAYFVAVASNSISATLCYFLLNSMRLLVCTYGSKNLVHNEGLRNPPKDCP